MQKKKTQSSLFSRTAKRLAGGARTYFLMTGAGVAAIASAPFFAAYRALRPVSQDKKLLDGLSNGLSKMAEQSFPGPLAFPGHLEGFDLSDILGENEPWKKKHRQMHGMSDQEYKQQNNNQNKQPPQD